MISGWYLAQVTEIMMASNRAGCINVKVVSYDVRLDLVGSCKSKDS
jgi:hypothetical protein